MKTLYTWTANKEIEVEKEEEIDGGKLIKKVKELKPVKFSIRRPNRALVDSNELFYGIEYNTAVLAGLLPKALFAKRLENDNGVFSNHQLEEQERLVEERNKVANEFTKLTEKPEAERSEEDKKAIAELFNKFTAVDRRLNEYEAAQQSMFDNTAENRATMKAILWYTLFLSYQENDKGELEPICPGETFKEKLAAYDKLEEDNDEFLLKAMQKFSLFATALYLRRASTEEDFKALDERLTIPEAAPTDKPAA